MDLLLVLCCEEVDSVPSSTLAEQLSSSSCFIHLCINTVRTHSGCHKHPFAPLDWFLIKASIAEWPTVKVMGHEGSPLGRTLTHTRQTGCVVHVYQRQTRPDQQVSGSRSVNSLKV